MYKRIQTLDGQTFDVTMEREYLLDKERHATWDEMREQLLEINWTMHYLNADDPPPMSVYPELRDGKIVLRSGDKAFPINAKTLLALLFPGQESKENYARDEVAVIYLKAFALLQDARREIWSLRSAIKAMEEYDVDW